MRFCYPAIFKKREDGSFEGRFPDLAGIAVTGYSLDDAIRNAIMAENDWLGVEFEDEAFPVLPTVSDLDDVELEEGEIWREIAVNFKFTEGFDE